MPRRPPLEIPWPRLGRSDNYAFDKQAPLTSSDAENVVNVEPSSDRDRGGTRPGLSKFNTSQLSPSAKIAELLSVAYNQKQVDYAEILSTPTSEWTTDTPSNEAAYAGQTDAEGNLFVLDGSGGFVKLSADGEEIIRVSVAGEDEFAQIRAMWVSERGNVYVGNSGKRDPSGGDANGILIGDPATSFIRKYRPDFAENDTDILEYELHWEITSESQFPIRGFVTALQVRRGRLYTAQNDTDRWKAYVVVYDSISTANPREVMVAEVPYPVADIAVKKDGSVLVSSEQFTQRGVDPTCPDCGIVREGWTPDDLNRELPTGEARYRIWRWHRSDDAETLITTSGLEPETGGDILLWKDKGPGKRHLSADFLGGNNAPKVKEGGLAGRIAVQLDGTMAFRTGTNPTLDPEQRDTQQSLFPAYYDPTDNDRSAQYAAFFVFRPKRTLSSAVGNQQVLWHQETARASTKPEAFLTNSTPADDASANNWSEAEVRWHGTSEIPGGGGEPIDESDCEGSGSGETPMGLEVASENGTGTVIVALISDGGVEPGNTDTLTRAILNINGRPIERFQESVDGGGITQKFTQLEALVGMARSTLSALGGYEGELYEILVLDRKDPESLTEPKVIEHEPHPFLDNGDAVGAVTILDGGTGWGASSSGALSFVGGGGSGAAGTWESDPGGRIVTTRLSASGSGFSSAPTVSAVGAGSGASFVAGMSDSASATVFDKVIGYLAHRYGVQDVLPTSTPYALKRTHTDGNNTGAYERIYPHPYATDPPENAESNGLSSYRLKSELLVKLSPSGAIVDVIGDFNGYGWAVEVLSDGNLATAGDPFATEDGGGAPATNASIRKIRDDGDSLSLTGADTYVGASQELAFDGPMRIAVDDFDNVYVPCNAPGATSTAKTLVVVDDTGSKIVQYDTGSGNAERRTFAAALPRKLGTQGEFVVDHPSYEAEAEVSQFVYILGDTLAYDGTTETPIVEKLRLVTATPNGAAPRAFKHVAVVGGDIKTFDNAASVATPTGGSGALRDAAGGREYVHGFVGDQKVYLTDGSAYRFYDPKEDVVAAWTAKRGAMPEGASMAELWAGRAVLFRFAGNASGWAMSAINDFDDWDEQPPQPTASQAVSGENTRAKDVPDIINGFCPYRDDYGLWLCDHSLWRLTGNPARGGVNDLVSTVTGGAFGRAWTQDHEGNVWFVSSRGGLWIFTPGARAPVEVSRDVVARALSDYDLMDVYWRLAYDARYSRVILSPHPFAAPSEKLTAWFYSVKTKAFWPWKIDDVTKQVTALWLFDGDEADDRVIVTGHGDGYIRKLDGAANDDDGTRLLSRVVIGPFQSREPGREIRANRLTVWLADNLDGCSFRFYASDRPDVMGAPRRTGRLQPGKNPGLAIRVRGAYFWLELFQGEQGSRFAYEKAIISYEVTGRVISRP